jgi:hypothetical protein
MDAPGPMDTRHIPEGMPPDRAYRWCLVRTTRDLRQSVRRGRAISLPGLRRLFTRRWLNVSLRCRPVVDREAEKAGVQRAERELLRMYRQEQPFRAWAATRDSIASNLHASV